MRLMQAGPAPIREDAETQDEALEVLAEGGGYVLRSLRRFGDAIRSPVLELGSGTGNVTLELLRQGHEVVATDVSASRLARLQERMLAELPAAKLRVAQVDLEHSHRLERHLQGSARSVVSFNVLEHLKDDAACARAAYEVLEPGGTFCLLVPAHQALYSRFDASIGHHRRYDVAGVRALLEGAGFAVRSCRYFNLVGALGWYVNCRLLKKTQLPAGQVKLFSRLSPVLALEDALPVPFGLSVIAIGVKAS